MHIACRGRHRSYQPPVDCNEGSCQRWRRKSYTDTVACRRKAFYIPYKLLHLAAGHPRQVYRERLCQSLNRQSFVHCVEERKKGSKEPATLVKMGWDGDVEHKSRKQLEDGLFPADSNVTTMQCPANEAYHRLVRLARGEEAWEGA